MAKRLAKDKVLHTKTTTTNQDGKTTEEKKQTIRIAQEPAYIKLYFNTLLVFKDLPKQMSPLLFELLKLTTYADIEAEHGGMLIVLNTFVKEGITKRLNIKMTTFDMSLTKFVKSGIIKRVGYGTYQANPYMFGMGDWSDIKAIRATFDFNTGTVKADIESNNPKSPLESFLDIPQSFLERAAAGQIAIDDDEEEDDD